MPTSPPIRFPTGSGLPNLDLLHSSSTFTVLRGHQPPPLSHYTKKASSPRWSKKEKKCIKGKRPESYLGLKSSIVLRTFRALFRTSLSAELDREPRRKRFIYTFGSAIKRTHFSTFSHRTQSMKFSSRRRSPSKRFGSCFFPLDSPASLFLALLSLSCVWRLPNGSAAKATEVWFVVIANGWEWGMGHSN